MNVRGLSLGLLCFVALQQAHDAKADGSGRRLTDQQISHLEDLATRGQAACEARQFEVCHTLFQQAQAMLPWPPHEYYMGEALVGLGRLNEGVRVWRAMVAANPTPNDPLVKDAVELAQQRLRDVEPTIPTLTFQVPLERRGKVVVRLDGRNLSVDQLSRALAIDPGNHVFELSEPGYVSERHDVMLAAGVNQRVLVALEPLPLPRPPAPTEEPATHWRVPVGVSLLAVGAGAMVGSLVLYLSKEELNRDLEYDCGPGATCALDREEYDARSAEIRERSRWTNVLLFGGAGLASLGAAGLIWNAVDTTDNGPSAKLSVVSGADFSGLRLHGRF